MTRRVYLARWVLPIVSPPIRDGAVVVDGARIAWVGRGSDAPDGLRHDLGASILMPGLVNVHTHLELTAMRGFLEDLSFRRWVVHLTKAREAAMTPERSMAAARVGIAEGLLAGITTFGDVSDTGRSLDAMQAMGVRGLSWLEVFGPSPSQCADALAGLRARVDSLRPRASDLVRLGVSPHAPYSVSDDLFAATAQYALDEALPVTVHIGESHDEWALVVDGQGAFADGLRARSIAVAPRGDSPVAMLDRLGVLRTRPVLVHAVRVTPEDQQRIAATGSSVAHCPASNAKLGHGVAPVMELLDLGVRVGLGTDSVASSNRMDLLDEARLAVFQQRASSQRFDALSGPAVLEMATMGGARVLGFEARIGSLEVGQDADLAAFPIDPVRDSPVFAPEDALIFGAAGRRAGLVTVAGRELVRDGRLLADLRQDLALLDEAGAALRVAHLSSATSPSR
jgi:cytosine/adenosine deaminase-related metal-dependent hydrolase